MRNTELEEIIDARVAEALAARDRPIPEVKPIPEARCTTLSWSVSRIRDGKVAASRDDGYTQALGAQEAQRRAIMGELPVRCIPWTVNPQSLVGEPDAILLLEEVRVKDNLGSNGRFPIHEWIYNSKMPAMLDEVRA
jgi:hypothetical protein